MDGVAEQCRALDNHHYYALISRFMLHKFNLQVVVNCLYATITELELQLVAFITKTIISSPNVTQPEHL